MKNVRQRRGGFTLVEIMIVVAIIGLLAGIAIPNFIRARGTAQQNSCIGNLRQIDGAKDQWAMENKKSAGDSTDEAGVLAYLKTGSTPSCPAGGTYSYNEVDSPPSCSVSGHTI